MDYFAVLRTAAYILIGILAGTIVFIITYSIIIWRRYNYLVEIINPFSREPTSTKGGIFIDAKTNQKLFYLRSGLFGKRFNVGLDPDKLPALHKRGKKKIYLVQDGLKNYRYIDWPKWYEDEQKCKQCKGKGKIEQTIKGQEGNEKVEVYCPMCLGIGEYSPHVQEEDMNWAVHDYQKYKVLLGPNKWSQMLPIIIWGVCVIGVLVLFMQLFKHMDVFRDLALQLKEIAQTNLQVAKELAAIKQSGGVV